MGSDWFNSTGYKPKNLLRLPQQTAFWALANENWSLFWGKRSDSWVKIIFLCYPGRTGRATSKDGEKKDITDRQHDGPQPGSCSQMKRNDVSHQEGKKGEDGTATEKQIIATDPATPRSQPG